MLQEQKFAVLIDAENVSPKYIELILDMMSMEGAVTYKRIYGDWTLPQNASWKAVLGSNAINPIQQYRYTTGKNASDSAMIIDAMDILYSGTVDGFCLVSSDSDFTRLASRLREAGKTVVGMGEEKTPRAFVSACNKFRYLDILYDNSERAKSQQNTARKSAKGGSQSSQAASSQPSQPAQAPAPVLAPPAILPAAKPKGKKAKEQPAPAEVQVFSPPYSQKLLDEIAGRCSEEAADVTPDKGGITSLGEIETLIAEIIAKQSDDDGWAFVSGVGGALGKREPGFDPINYGFKRLLPFLESFKRFQLDRVETDTPNVYHMMIRDRQAHRD